MKNPILTPVALALALGLASASTSNAQSYFANLSGPAESPANASPGTGLANVDIFTGVSGVDDTMHIHIVFSGLVGTTTASHIHAATAVPGTGTAGVATTTPYFTGFPIGVTSGTFDTILDLTLASSYNGSYITAHGGTTAGAEAALLASIAADTAYLNIHTTAFGGGEIRGFLTPVPEPGTLAILGAAAVVGFVAKRRNS
jgi:hypothetical protein